MGEEVTFPAVSKEPWLEEVRKKHKALMHVSFSILVLVFIKNFLDIKKH